MEDRFFTVEAVLIDPNGQQTQVAARTSFFTRRALGTIRCRGAFLVVTCAAQERWWSCRFGAEASAATAAGEEEEEVEARGGGGGAGGGVEPFNLQILWQLAGGCWVSGRGWITRICRERYS